MRKFEVDPQGNAKKVEISPEEGRRLNELSYEADKKIRAEKNKDHKVYTPDESLYTWFSNMTGVSWGNKERSRSYSETLLLNPDGSFNRHERAGGGVPFAVGDAKTPDELYKICRTIIEKHPEMKIEFEKDPEGKWIRYTVSE